METVRDSAGAHSVISPGVLVIVRVMSIYVALYVMSLGWAITYRGARDVFPSNDAA